jgi:hypothetical protein
MPDQDAVVAITAETADMQDEINLVWKFLLPGMENESLPSDDKALAELKQKLAALKLPIPEIIPVSPVQTEITDKTFILDQGDHQPGAVKFRFIDNECQVDLLYPSDTFKLAYGSGIWIEGFTNKYGPYLVNSPNINFTHLKPFRVAGAYAWKENNTLQLVLRYIESPHTEIFTCSFEQEKIRIEVKHSNRRNANPSVWTGQMVK